MHMDCFNAIILYILRKHTGFFSFFVTCSSWKQNAIKNTKNAVMNKLLVICYEVKMNNILNVHLVSFHLVRNEQSHAHYWGQMTMIPKWWNQNTERLSHQFIIIYNKNGRDTVIFHQSLLFVVTGDDFQEL